MDSQLITVQIAHVFSSHVANLFSRTVQVDALTQHEKCVGSSKGLVFCHVHVYKLYNSICSCSC